MTNDQTDDPATNAYLALLTDEVQHLCQGQPPVVTAACLIGCMKAVQILEGARRSGKPQPDLTKAAEWLEGCVEILRPDSEKHEA